MVIHVPTAPWAHTVFDLLAWSSGLATSVALYRWRLKAVADRAARVVDGGYFVALALGAVPGAWLAGSANSLREHAPTLSHSVAGALVGAIVGIEIYKAIRGVKGSTGGVFVGSFSVGLVIGRLGCFFSGLADDTYGAPTRLPWGVDLGDGISRHPIQLYESLAMAAFLAAYLVGLRQRRPWAMHRGFYAMCMAYGAQRFAWEFLKPYPRLIGPFNLFHLLCLGLVSYGWIYFIADLSREKRGPGGRREEVCALPVPGADHEPVRDLP